MFVANEVSKYFSEKLKKINIYIVFQYLWVIILYYLVLNIVIYKYILYLVDMIFSVKIPDLIIDYNNFILDIFSVWMPFILILSIGLIISSVFISPIKWLPYIKNYKMALLGEDGMYFGTWLFIIVFTYYLYIWLGGFFPILVSVAGILNDTLAEKRKRHLSY